jgi:hypothetical protein
VIAARMSAAISGTGVPASRFAYAGYKASAKIRE